jgi:hydroxymethylglutaryl-CoA reductase
MALTFNIQNNEFLREVFEEGQQAGEMTLLHRLLERRFGALPEWAVQQLATAETSALEAWGLRLLEAASLEEVLRTP